MDESELQEGAGSQNVQVKEAHDPNHVPERLQLLSNSEVDSRRADRGLEK